MHKILAEIVDGRSGNPDYMFYFSNLPGYTYSEPWTSSLDIHYLNQVVHFLHNGALDQAWSAGKNLQRPALHEELSDILTCIKMQSYYAEELTII